MAFLIFFFGIALLLIGGSILMKEAFSEGVIWGIGCIVFYPIVLFIAYMRWDDCKKGVAYQVTGIILLFVADFIE